MNSYFIWMGRIGLLESVFTFFLCLGLYYCLKALETDPKYFAYSGLYWGLSILTKYTFLFFAPGILAYILWRQRWIFKNKKFWIGAAIFLAVSSPILIYNLGMLGARGHFDVQFSDFFGQVHNDWPKLAKRVSFAHVNPGGVLAMLLEGFSWPYFAIFTLSFLGALYLFRKSLKIFVVFFFVSPLVFFSFIGASSLWLGALAPFAALIIGLTLADMLKERNYAAYGGLALLASFFLFYSLNTNTFIKAKGHKLLYANFRSENYGYNQLDKEISQLLQDRRSPQKIQQAVNFAWYGKIRPEAINFALLREGQDFNAVVVYDSNSVWFATSWIFERWKLYKRMFLPATYEFVSMVESEVGKEILEKLSPLQIYFIESGPEVRNRADIQLPEGPRKLVEIFQKQNIKPEIVHDNQGREAFYIYKGAINFH